MSEPVEGHLAVLTDERLLDDTMTVLSEHIPLPIQGYRSQTADLWRVLIMAAASGLTIEAACASLAAAPHPNTVRTSLADHWTPEAIPLLEGQINAALHASLPAWLWDRPLELAADCHDCPFYGKHDPTSDDDWVTLRWGLTPRGFSRLAASPGTLWVSPCPGDDAPASGYPPLASGADSQSYDTWFVVVAESAPPLQTGSARADWPPQPHPDVPENHRPDSAGTLWVTRPWGFCRCLQAGVGQV